MQAILCRIIEIDVSLLIWFAIQSRLLGPCVGSAMKMAIRSGAAPRHIVAC